MPDLVQGNTYTLSTLAPAILGARLERAYLAGIFTYEVARKFENVDLQYRQVFPVLPSGTPDAGVKACTFYYFTLESGGTKVLADLWIDESTVTLVDGINFDIRFTGKASADVQRIRDILNAMGETSYEIIIQN